MNYRKLVPFLFLIGFFYYLITPVGIYFLFSELDPNLVYIKSLDLGLLQNSLKYYGNGNVFNLNYLLDLVIILLTFFIGYLIGLRYTSKTKSSFDALVNFKLGFKIINILSVISFIVLIIFLYSKQFSFFQGYKNFNVIYLGLLSSFLLLLTYFYVFFRQTNRSIIILFLIILISIILLGSGSRNIVLYSLLPVFIVNQSLSAKFNKRNFFVLGVFLVTILVCVGMLRLGYEFALGPFISHFFIDSFNVMASFACYFDGLTSRPVLNIPNGLWAGIVNILPSLLFPEKFEFIKNITYDPAFCSPFGGASILMTMYQNFGMFYPIYFIVIGYIFGCLVVKSSYSTFYKSILFAVLPFIMFELYNQPLYAQFKLFFYNGMLIPVCVMFFLLILKKLKY